MNIKDMSRVLLGFTALLMMQGCLSVIPLIAPKVDDVEPGISDDFDFESHYVEVLDSEMHYVESGSGPVLLLVHGNPTSAYLWRNIIPLLDDDYRVIALDLIGMGKSDKPDLNYRLADHIRYFEAFVDAMALYDITLVLHDWGGAIGLDYAANHENNVKAIALMEAVIKPMRWDDADMATSYLFKRLRDEKDSHQIVSIDNFFVEKMLPMMSGRDLSEKEMQFYRSPYPDVKSRLPVEQWPKEIPLDDSPKDNADRIASNYDWLKRTELPTLVLHASPGLIFSEEFVDTMKQEIPRIETANVGNGLHYIQETQPTTMGTKINVWRSSVRAIR